MYETTIESFLKLMSDKKDQQIHVKGIESVHVLTKNTNYNINLVFPDVAWSSMILSDPDRFSHVNFDLLLSQLIGTENGHNWYFMIDRVKIYMGLSAWAQLVLTERCTLG